MGIQVKIVETDDLNPVFCFRNIQSGIRRNSSCYIAFVNNGFQDVYGGNFQTMTSLTAFADKLENSLI